MILFPVYKVIIINCCCKLEAYKYVWMYKWTCEEIKQQQLRHKRRRILLNRVLSLLLCVCVCVCVWVLFLLLRIISFSNYLAVSSLSNNCTLNKAEHIMLMIWLDFGNFRPTVCPGNFEFGHFSNRITESQIFQ